MYIRVYRSVDNLMCCEWFDEDDDYGDVDDKNDDFNDDDAGEMVMSITMMITYIMDTRLFYLPILRTDICV